ncbi:MAG TPA: amylo-alpha-1,6-glucosidase [Patescibacteria group bacterium]|nr:amylo-alpha-1,6-glucosidase [Patescibacteria group bacterium]
MNYEDLRTKFYNYLIELSHAEGINASGKNEVYGCIFGRDSFITILKILHAIERQPDEQLLAICKRSLLKHVELQGKESNIESGEQPGKFIHEYRVANYERLTVNLPVPWYVYPDNKLRNYDSIDATPLALIAIYKYWQVSGDNEFVLSVLPSVESGLNWLITYGDMDKDILLEYELPKARSHGGLSVQSWTDSYESLTNIFGKLPPYPIAPVEVQGIAWLALTIWADFYMNNSMGINNVIFGQKLHFQAQKLKERFNDLYLLKNKGLWFAAQALNGRKEKISTITANPLICLWAAFSHDGKKECIIDEKYLGQLVERAFLPDMFVPNAGIRTMSEESPTFSASESSYHNGSFWPMLNGLIIEGLQNFGFEEKATKLHQAMLEPLLYFQMPIELYIEQNGNYLPFKNNDQTSCSIQAWSAAAAFDELSS